LIIIIIGKMGRAGVFALPKDFSERVLFETIY
jgi:hypothetical protein